MDEKTPMEEYNPQSEYAPIEPDLPETPAAPMIDQDNVRHYDPAAIHEPQRDYQSPQNRYFGAQVPQDFGGSCVTPQYPTSGYRQVQSHYQPGQGFPQPAQPTYPAAPTYPQPMTPQQSPWQPPMPQNPIPNQPMPQNGYPQPGFAPQPINEPPAQGFQNQNPYAPQQPQQPGFAPEQGAAPAPRAKTPVSTIVFLSLIAVMLIGFIVFFIFYLSSKPNNASNSENAFGHSATEPFGGLIEEDDPGAISENATEFDVEVKLVADNGETQKNGNDNEASVGKPDKNAKSVTLAPLPKDKDEKKYTIQSSYDAVSDAVVSVLCYQEKITDNKADIVSQGTGTIISSDGYLITNAHVIRNSRSLLVNIVLNSGEEHQAKIIGFDTWTDLAVLKIDAKNLKAVTFGDSEKIEIGDDVLAIGNPGGTSFKNSLTKGIVSAVDRELIINKNVKYIQHDAAINPGNSGGPLCNIYGQVIGINSVKITSELYEGMSFSIPSSTVEEIVNDLMHEGYVKGRVRIGFSGYEMTAETAFYGYPAGVMIDEIDENGSLAGTDVKKNDIIYAIDGVEVSSFQDIFDILADHKEGDKIKLSVYRNDDLSDLK